MTTKKSMLKKIRPIKMRIKTLNLMKFVNCIFTEGDG